MPGKKGSKAAKASRKTKGSSRKSAKKAGAKKGTKKTTKMKGTGKGGAPSVKSGKKGAAKGKATVEGKKDAAKGKKTKAPIKKRAERETQWEIVTHDKVIAALRHVMKTRGIVRSQHKLRKLVLQRLRETDPKATVSEQRIRYLAVNQSFIKTEIHCRTTRTRSAMSRCPVCGGRLKAIKNQTVFGGTVTLEHRCTRCRYWTGVKRRTPSNYIFTHRG